MTMTGVGAWLLDGAVRDAQTITARWTPAETALIDGVAIVEVRNVPKAQGHLTEVFRQDWSTLPAPVDQVFQVVMNPGGLSAWHAHERTTDRLFVTHGLVRIALFDGREDSATRGQVNEFKFGAIRPALVTIPPRVWHGVQNIGTGTAAVLNIVDRAYDYEHPDHWRVPHDSPAIPFRWI